MGRAGIDPETVTLGILAIGALDLRIVDAGLGDGAFGVIESPRVLWRALFVPHAAFEVGSFN
jgi:hypothetical protein